MPSLTECPKCNREYTDLEPGDRCRRREPAAECPAATYHCPGQVKRVLIVETHLSELFRIIDGALRGDAKKVRAYSEFLADKLEASGETTKARLLRKLIAGEGEVIRALSAPERDAET